MHTQYFTIIALAVLFNFTSFVFSLSCKVDSDCVLGYVCSSNPSTNGQCIYGCHYDYDCLFDTTDTQNQKCDTTKTTWSCTCGSNTVCPGDGQCVDGHCINYNRQQAVNYAVNYCCHPNAKACPVQKNAASTEEDCTNFASQVLNSGGIPTSKDWQCATPAWINVDKFYDYIINQEKIAKVCQLEDLQPGDFIQYYGGDWWNPFSWPFAWKHTTIVIEESATNPKLVYHSTNRCVSDHVCVHNYFNNKFRCLCINSPPPSSITLPSVSENNKCDKC